MIDKPAGLVVHPAPGHWDDTLVNALVARGTTLAGGAEGRPGIVHRLDRDTSGLMVVAKTDLAHRRLGAAIAAAAGAADLRGAGVGTSRREPDRDRSAARAAPDRPQADGDERPWTAGADRCLRGRAIQRRASCFGSSCTPGGPTRSGSTSSTSATRWWATRSTPAGVAAGSRVPPGRKREAHRAGHAEAGTSRGRSGIPPSRDRGERWNSGPNGRPICRTALRFAAGERSCCSP